MRIFKKELNCYLWTGSNFEELKKVFGHLVSIGFDTDGNSFFKIRKINYSAGFQRVSKNSYLYLDATGDMCAATEEKLKKQGWM